MTKVHPSVRHSILGKNWLRDENGKGTMGLGSGMRLLCGLVRSVRGREGDSVGGAPCVLHTGTASNNNNNNNNK